MPTSLVENLVGKIKSRKLDDGGFSEQEKGSYRPDATSWAVLAFQAAGVDPEIIWSAQSRLVRDQTKIGRIPISPEHPESFWPTPLAILAWHKSDRFKQATLFASQFLLDVKGIHFEKEKDSPMGHDTSIQGWPWVEKTHSWVEPTCLSVLALQAAGFGSHKRVDEGLKMILDRQLPAGGWNLGNTIVFGKELHPFPDFTGMALSALATHASNAQVSRSLKYLEGEVSLIKSPIGMGNIRAGFLGDSPDGICEFNLGNSEKREKVWEVQHYSLLSFINSFFG